VVVATHGHCFDGMASAAVFTRLYQRLFPGSGASFTYRTCDYGPGDSAVPASWMTGDDNAILDFRYTALPTLTWYFDHHATAFRGDSDREHYEQQPPDRRFHDAAYSSCTRLIADTARDRFGEPLDGLAELIHWADVIDTARFASAQEAVQRAEPELHLMTVLEHHGDDALLALLVPRLLTESLASVARSQEIQNRYAPLARRRERAIELMRAHAQLRGPVAYCDLSEMSLDVVEKFGLYWLFPASTYSVALTRSGARAKISIGYNPWGPTPRSHHIGEICRRHGGGGHPVVGAINFAASEMERARAICAEVLLELGA